MIIRKSPNNLFSNLYFHSVDNEDWTRGNNSWAAIIMYNGVKHVIKKTIGKLTWKKKIEWRTITKFNKTDWADRKYVYYNHFLTAQIIKKKHYLLKTTFHFWHTV